MYKAWVINLKFTSQSQACISPQNYKTCYSNLENFNKRPTNTNNIFVITIDLNKKYKKLKIKTQKNQRTLDSKIVNRANLTSRTNKPHYALHSNQSICEHKCLFSKNAYQKKISCITLMPKWASYLWVGRSPSSHLWPPSPCFSSEWRLLFSLVENSECNQ